jgi:hypothetical protein
MTIRTDTRGAVDPAHVAAAREALEALDGPAFLDVVLDAAAARGEWLAPVGRRLAAELWSETVDDLGDGAAPFDEAVWAEICRDGRWHRVLQAALNDLRAQAALVVDIVADDRTR